MSAVAQHVVILGGGGRFATALRPAFESAGWTVSSLDRHALDITDREAVELAVRTHRPDAVVNAAAWADLDRCELDPAGAYLVNATAVGHLREVAGAIGAHFCHISTDYVFDGAQSAPYVEEDVARPLSVYGSSKLQGEQDAGPDASVVRVAWVSGRGGRSLVRSALEKAADPTRRLRFVTDQLGSPSVAEDLVPVVVEVVANRAAGLFHVANEGQTSPWELARWTLDVAGYDANRVEAVRRADLPTPVSVRPVQSALDASKVVRTFGVPLRPWQEAVEELVGHLVRDGLGP